MRELPSYPHGIDLMWFAVDQNGHVAGLTTAGIGPIPIAALFPHEQEELGMALSGMKVTTAALLEVQLPRPDDFAGLAERGWFAYDWSDVHRSLAREIRMYERIAAPAQPMSVDTLPERFRAAVVGVKIPAAFCSSKTLDVRGLLDCVEPTVRR